MYLKFFILLFLYKKQYFYIILDEKVLIYLKIIEL